jgi:hypothetical protein
MRFSPMSGPESRWRDLLTADDCRHYEEMAVRELGETRTHWLETGER